MQSIPKNVHTGLLIGSKTGKSPGQTNNLFAPHMESSATTMTSTPSPISGGSIPSSTILTSIRPENIKTECETGMHELDAANRYHLYRKFDLGSNGNGAGGTTDTYCFNGQPNYSLNPKLLEQPEMSVSPARGSTGLPGLPPVQVGATQPRGDLNSPYGECKSPFSPYDEFKSPHSRVSSERTLSDSANGIPRGDTMTTSTPVASSTGARRARVGKSMAREIVMQSHTIKTDPTSTDDVAMVRIKDCDEEYPTKQVPHFLANQSNGNADVASNNLIIDIKEENVKTECDDDVEVISDKSSPNDRITDKTLDSSMNGGNDTTASTPGTPSSLNASLKRRSDTEHSFDDDLIIDLDGPSIEHSIMATKRRKILEFHKNPNKKSPPNSYKSLIKPSVSKSYLCKAERQEENGLSTARPHNADTAHHRRMHVDDAADETNESANESIARHDEAERTRDSSSGDVVCIDDSDSVDDTKSKANDAIDAIMTDTSTMRNDSSKSSVPEIIEIDENKTATSEANDTPWPSIADEFPQALTLEKENFMSSLELTIDQVAKGYFSDNEILSHKQQRLKSKLKLTEGRSRSESKKGATTANSTATKSQLTSLSSSTTSKPKTNSKKTRERSTSSAKSIERSNSKTTTKLSKAERTPTVERESEKKSTAKKNTSISMSSSSSSSSSSSMTTPNASPATPTTSKKNAAKSALTATKSKGGKTVKEKIDERKLDELLVSESFSNNNNNILIANNNKVHSNAVSMAESLTASTVADAIAAAAAIDTRSPTPIGGRVSSNKKPKSRGCKFSNKKRHRTRNVKEIEEIIVPRRSSAVPRWSNGWQWLGEPFQGKVFLNVSRMQLAQRTQYQHVNALLPHSQSDDHQVVRTRYPAMVHDCGDIVRPGDCVLLRAGSKKNELGYVAKVASLWENPEDGKAHTIEFDLIHFSIVRV